MSHVWKESPTTTRPKPPSRKGQPWKHKTTLIEYTLVISSLLEGHKGWKSLTQINIGWMFGTGTLKHYRIWWWSFWMTQIMPSWTQTYAGKSCRYTLISICTYRSKKYSNTVHPNHLVVWLLGLLPNQIPRCSQKSCGGFFPYWIQLYFNLKPKVWCGDRDVWLKLVERNTPNATPNINMGDNMV